LQAPSLRISSLSHCFYMLCPLASTTLFINLCLFMERHFGFNYGTFLAVTQLRTRGVSSSIFTVIVVPVSSWIGYVGSDGMHRALTRILCVETTTTTATISNIDVVDRFHFSHMHALVMNSTNKLVWFLDHCICLAFSFSRLACMHMLVLFVALLQTTEVANASQDSFLFCLSSPQHFGVCACIIRW